MKIKRYQPPEIILDSCGLCPFSAGGHGFFCGHPYIVKNRGDKGIPKVSSVTYYMRIPDWCPLPDIAENVEQEERE